MEILNLREHPPGDKVIATFDLYLGPQWGMTFYYLRLIKGKHGPFIAIPSKMEEQFGENKFFPFIGFSKEKKASFDSKVLELLKPLLHI